MLNSTIINQNLKPEMLHVVTYEGVIIIDSVPSQVFLFEKEFDMAKKISIFCAQCGESKEIILAEKKKNNFCNSKCQGKWFDKKISIICAQCGKTKKISPSFKNDYNFCNRKCKGQWLKENRSEKNNSQWNRITILCAWCNKPKEIIPSQKKKHNFCNFNCKGKWLTKNNTGKKHPNWKEKIIVYCQQCGKSKKVCPSKKKNQKNGVFCNYKCWGKWIKENRSGENSYNWQGGIASEPYCIIWLDKDYKKSIKERDNYTCQNPDCWHTANRLVGHHINYDKKNCHPWNVITICNSCNGRANKNRKYWTKFYQDIMTEKYGYEYK